MIEQTVVIIAIEDQDAWVESLPQTGCERCDAGEGCGGGIFARIFGNKQFQLKIPNLLNAGLHEKVVIGISENAITSGSILLYLLPLMGLFTGAVLGQIIDQKLHHLNSEFWTLMLSLIFGIVTFLLVKIFLNKESYQMKYRPRMLRKSSTVNICPPS